MVKWSLFREDNEFHATALMCRMVLFMCNASLYISVIELCMHSGGQKQYGVNEKKGSYK